MPTPLARTEGSVRVLRAALRAKLASYARHLPVLSVVAWHLEALREAYDPKVVERVERLGGIDPTLALRILFLARRRLLPSTRVITLPPVSSSSPSSRRGSRSSRRGAARRRTRCPSAS